MTGRPEPDEVIERGAVEIVHDELTVASGGVPRKLGFTEVERRPLDFCPPAGNGVGVVWQLTRQSPVA